MKRMIWMLMFIFVMPLGITAQAEENQDNWTWEIGVGGGYFIPNVDGYFESGSLKINSLSYPSTINLRIKINPPESNLGVGLDIDYFQKWELYRKDITELTYKDITELIYKEEIYRATMGAILFNVQYDFLPSKSISAFLGGGIGLYRLNIDRTYYESKLRKTSNDSTFSDFTHSGSTQKNPVHLAIKAGFDYSIFRGFVIGIEYKYYVVSEYFTDKPLSWISPILNVKYRF